MGARPSRRTEHPKWNIDMLPIHGFVLKETSFKAVYHLYSAKAPVNGITIELLNIPIFTLME